MNIEIIPNLDWYQEKSRSLNGPPRCPFAALRRCPKYYSSVWIMGNFGGAAKIDEITDKELLKYWEQTDLWPIPRELEPWAAGPENETHLFSNICPEVAYDRFGYFASNLYAYADEIDRDGAHRILSQKGADRNDWRWAWSSMVAQHYSECPMYSQLLAGVNELQISSSKNKIGF